MAADLVFRGGSAFVPTGSSSGVSRPLNVAVSDGIINAVGGDDVLELIGSSTRVEDISGRLLIPGFTDAHVHPVQAGLVMRSCDLSAVSTEPEYLALIKAYADAHPRDSWITGACWMMAAFPGGVPRRESLDSVVPDRPAYFPNRDHHGAWVNSVALKLAGIDAGTPDPPDGRIERDPDGTPTGVLHEGAMHLISDQLPRATHDDHVEALLLAQEYLHALGITGWQDAIIGSYSNMTDPSSAYQQCADDGRLTAKVVGALWWDRTRGVSQIPELEQRRAQHPSGRFRATSIKIMQDGVAENFTAAMTLPYLDGQGHPTHNSGHSMVEPAELSACVTELDALGFQVHVHAIGDRAVREALDAFEAASAANGDSDNRHHIAHIQVVHPDDVDRFAQLGVAANMQPLWASHEPQMDELTIPFLGAERSDWQYPFEGLRAAGARLVAGSDWPVSSPNPLWGIHVAVNRTAVPEEGDPGEVFIARERLSVADALVAYTSGSAWINHNESSGRIAVGAAADVAVVDRDVVSGPPEEICDARIVATFVDGSCVYREA